MTSATGTIEFVRKSVAEDNICISDLVAVAEESIKDHDPIINSFISLCETRSLQAAENLANIDISAISRMPLYGVLVSVKDVIDVAGVPTTAGTSVLANNIPERDSEIVARLTEAGAIIVGKNNMHELALGVTTNNPHYGICRNPWNTDHIPGGSSGGSAAAVAAGFSTLSVGGDSGGSIRIPAALNGLVGMKPTQGLLPKNGVFTGTWSLDSTGPISRTVSDNATLLSVLSGIPNRDLLDTDMVSNSCQSNPEKLSDVVIGVPESYFFEGLDREVEAAVSNAIEVLQGLGAEVHQVDIPSAVYSVEVGAVISWSEYSRSQELLFKEHSEQLGADVRSILETASGYLARDYLAAQQARSVIIREYQSLWDDVDILLTPTTPIPAPKVDKPVLFEVAKLTRSASLTGEPAVSIPCGFTTSGLPIGMHLQTKRYGEPLLYRVAYVYESETDWYRTVPPNSFDLWKKFKDK